MAKVITREALNGDGKFLNRIACRSARWSRALVGKLFVPCAQDVPKAARRTASPVSSNTFSFVYTSARSRLPRCPTVVWSSAQQAWPRVGTYSEMDDWRWVFLWNKLFKIMPHIPWSPGNQHYLLVILFRCCVGRPSWPCTKAEHPKVSLHRARDGSLSLHELRFRRIRSQCHAIFGHLADEPQNRAEIGITASDPKLPLKWQTGRCVAWRAVANCKLPSNTVSPLFVILFRLKMKPIRMAEKLLQKKTQTETEWLLTDDLWRVGWAAMLTGRSMCSV